MKGMYQVMAFWTAIFTIMFYLGHMLAPAVIFLGITGFFLTVAFLKVSERMAVYVFGAFLTIFFVGFTYYTTFIMPVGGVGH